MRSERTSRSTRTGRLRAGGIPLVLALTAACSTTTPVSTPDPASSPSPSSARPSRTLPAPVPPTIAVGAYGEPAETWPGAGITNVYLNIDENGERFPRDRLQESLRRGISLQVTISARFTDYLAGIADGDEEATDWLRAYVENIQALAEYAGSLNNATFVVATIWHESEAQIADGYVSGESADYAVIGRAQQQAIRLGKRLAPDAYWSVWLVGYNREAEGRQLAQITSPRPDLLTIDPYANRDCDDTLASIASEDLDWLRQQDAYNGSLAISETGMAATCPDDRLAAFYTDVRGQLQDLGSDVRYYVMFNRDSGRYPHVITYGNRPRAAEALRLSMQPGAEGSAQ